MAEDKNTYKFGKRLLFIPLPFRPNQSLSYSIMLDRPLPSPYRLRAIAQITQYFFFRL
jgi:hypothetical protein